MHERVISARSKTARDLVGRGPETVESVRRFSTLCTPRKQFIRAEAGSRPRLLPRLVLLRLLLTTLRLGRLLTRPIRLLLLRLRRWGRLLTRVLAAHIE
jgi:hypothetical protein